MSWREWIKKPQVHIGIAAAVIVIGIVGFVGHLRHAWTEGNELMPVVVTRDVLPIYHAISQDDIRVEMVPKQYRNPMSIADADDVIGRTTLVALADGEHVAYSHLSTQGSHISSRIPKYKRVVAIPVDRALLLPAQEGDRIDILVTTILSGMDGKMPQSRLVAANVPVVGIGANEKYPSGPALYGLVSPDQAIALANAIKEGTISVMARPMKEDE